MEQSWNCGARALTPDFRQADFSWIRELAGGWDPVGNRSEEWIYSGKLVALYGQHTLRAGMIQLHTQEYKQTYKLVWLSRQLVVEHTEAGAGYSVGIQKQWPDMQGFCQESQSSPEGHAHRNQQEQQKSCFCCTGRKRLNTWGLWLNWVIDLATVIDIVLLDWGTQCFLCLSLHPYGLLGLCFLKTRKRRKTSSGVWYLPISNFELG